MRGGTFEKTDGGPGHGDEKQHGRRHGDGQGSARRKRQGLGHQFADDHMEVGDDGETKGERRGDDVGVEQGVGSVSGKRLKPGRRRTWAARGSPIQPRASEQSVTPS